MILTFDIQVTRIWQEDGQDGWRFVAFTVNGEEDYCVRSDDGRCEIRPFDEGGDSAGSVIDAIRAAVEQECKKYLHNAENA